MTALRYFTLPPASVLALVLAGCGGGTSPTAPPAGGNGGEDAMLTISEGLAAGSDEPVRAVSGIAGLMSSLLPGGANAFPVLSSAVETSYQDNTVSASGDGHIKSISSDGSGGFRLTLAIAGRDGEADEEMTVHFPAESFADGRYFVELGEDDFYLNDRLGSFEQADRTSGSPRDAYFDILRLAAYTDSGTEARFAFGARTPAEGLPKGRAAYYGRLSNSGHGMRMTAMCTTTTEAA